MARHLAGHFSSPNGIRDRVTGKSCSAKTKSLVHRSCRFNAVQHHIRPHALRYGNSVLIRWKSTPAGDFRFSYTTTGQTLILKNRIEISLQCS